MRAALATLLLAALASAPAAQGTPFSDPDFGFSMLLPPGLQPADEAGRAKVLGDPELARNLSRAESGGQPLRHYHFWSDASTPYNRQAAIYLLDVPPPFKPDDFAASLEREGLQLVGQENLKSVTGWLVEGTFLRPSDQVRLHKYALYLPDLFGKRHGLVTLQAFDSDWNIVKAEFRAALESVRMERAAPPPEVMQQMQQQGAGGGPGKPGPRPGGGAGHAAGATAEPAGDWGSLEVAGSLVLAALALAHLLLSGRGAR